MRRLRALLVAVAVVAALALGACLGVDDASVNGKDKTAFEPDSVRGNTTFYSYQFRVPRPAIGWPVHDLVAPTKIAVVSGGHWLLPKFIWSSGEARERDAAVPNRFRLICNTVDSVTTDDIRARAFAAIEAAGATIEIHLSADSTTTHPLGVYHPGSEFFDVYHPSAQFLIGRLPASVRLMEFLGALDDTTAFMAVHPFIDALPL